jgi:hypothetical protein
MLRLQNKAPDSISLHHGYIGVRNRDTRAEEEEGNATVSLEEAAVEEAKWFKQVCIFRNSKEYTVIDRIGDSTTPL